MPRVAGLPKDMKKRAKLALFTIFLALLFFFVFHTYASNRASVTVTIKFIEKPSVAYLEGSEHESSLLSTEREEGLIDDQTEKDQFNRRNKDQKNENPVKIYYSESL